MNNDEFIEAVRRDRENELRFFSNLAKPERERSVVRDFLDNLSIFAEEEDLSSPEQDHDVDVKFREANFQVKEIPDPDSRRSSEVRAALRRAETATRPEELFDTPTAYDIVWVNAYPLIQQQASNPRYPQGRRSKLDLLFYITHKYAFLDRNAQPMELSSLGWRSISCLYGPHSYVLIAANDAPSFLRDHYSGR